MAERARKAAAGSRWRQRGKTESAGKPASVELEREREAFRLIAQAALGSQSVTILCRRVLKGLLDTLDFHFGSIRLYEERSRLLKPVAVIGLGKAKARTLATNQALGDRRVLAAHAARTGRPIFAPDTAAGRFSAAHRARFADLGARALVVWPVKGSQSSLLGVITLAARRPREIPREDRAFFETVASLFAAVLERQLAVDDLMLSEGNARALLDASPESAFLFDPEGTVIALNEVAAGRLGRKPAELIGKNARDFLPAEVAESRLDKARLARRTKQPLRYQDERDGICFDIFAKPILDGRGRVVRWGVFAHDITEQRKVLAALRESEEKYRSLVEQSQQGIIVIQDDRCVFANAAFAEILGVPVAELTAKKPEEFSRYIHPEDRQTAFGRFRNHTEGRTVPEQATTRLVRPDGTIRWILSSGRSISYQGRTAMQATIVDITEQRHTLESLRESEEKYRSLVERSHLGIVVLQDSRHVFANAAMAEILGCTVTELLALPPERFSEYLHPEDRGAVLGRYQKRLQGKETQARYTCRFLRPDGGMRWVDVIAQRISYLGRPAVQASLIDITDRKQAEEARREAEASYRSLVEQIPAIIYTAAIDEASTTLFVSPQVEEVLGVSPRDCTADPDTWRRLLHPEDRQRVVEEVRRCHETGASFDAEYRMLAADGREVWMRDSARIVRDREGKALLLQGVMQDITRLKRLEERLLEAHRLEAVGRLARGVAHDIANMVTVIRGGTSNLLHGLEEGDPLREEAQEIRQASERAAALTRQLVALSRGQLLRPRPLDLALFARELQGMLRTLLGGRFRVSVRAGTGSAMVVADPAQLEQVGINLALNARDAMARGGRLHLAVDGVVLDEESCRGIPGLLAGPYVRLAVSDSGSGIPPEALPHVFEPFFSTKGRGRGTGLGLSVVYGIIRQHGGAITVESALQTGTTFRIYLPSLVGEVSGEESTAPAPARGRKRGRRVLLVEDDGGIRRLALRALTARRFAVTEAESAEQALELFERQGGDFRLLLSDVGLPGMDGVELAQICLRRHPGMAVLLTSAQASIGTRTRMIRDGRADFLQKPFTTGELQRAALGALACKGEPAAPAGGAGRGRDREPPERRNRPSVSPRRTGSEAGKSSRRRAS